MITRLAAAFALAVAPAAADAAACAPTTAPPPVESVKAMYAAAMAGDKGGVARVLAPDFYAFDDGKRFGAPDFAGQVDMLKAAHLTMKWTVNAPRTTVACDVAWVTWVNDGSATDSGGTHQLEWLESAIERWQDGAWKIAFFHSTPVSAPAH